MLSVGLWHQILAGRDQPRATIMPMQPRTELIKHDQYVVHTRVHLKYSDICRATELDRVTPVIRV